MSRERHIWIVGIKHSGKSAVGSRVARRARLQFVDTDQVILSRYRRSASTPDTSPSTIRDLFRTIGSERFQELQLEVVRLLGSGRKKTIAATGGGIADSIESMEILSSTGLVVHLKPPWREAWSRIVTGGIPSFLPGIEPEAEFQVIAQRRQMVYDRYADIVVDTAAKSVEEVQKAVEQILSERLSGR